MALNTLVGKAVWNYCYRRGEEPTYCGEHLLEAVPLEGVVGVLCATTISSSRKSFHRSYGDIGTYYPEAKFDESRGVLYIRPAVPGSFIGRNGCNIKEMNRMYSRVGIRVEMMVDGNI